MSIANMHQEMTHLVAATGYTPTQYCHCNKNKPINVFSNEKNITQI